MVGHKGNRVPYWSSYINGMMANFVGDFWWWMEDNKSLCDRVWRFGGGFFPRISGTAAFCAGSDAEVRLFLPSADLNASDSSLRRFLILRSRATRQFKLKPGNFVPC